MYMLILLFLLLPITTFADNSSQTDTNNSTATTSQKPKNLFFCPPIKSIKKDPVKLTWSAPGGWKSYEISFDNKIIEFYGAQWNGENVGQITCLYKGDVPSAFPILLVFDTLTYQPSGGQWSKDLGGYQNCVSRKRSDCPFKIRLKPPKEDVYKEAEQLKSNSND